MMPPIPIGLVGLDKSDCDRNYLVDPNCPMPSDQDINKDKGEVVPLNWDDLEMDKDDVTSTTEVIKVVNNELSKQIIDKITEEITKATKKTTVTEVAQGDYYSSTTGYQVTHDINMPRESEEDSFTVIMTIGGFVISVVVIGSIGNIYIAILDLETNISACSFLRLQDQQNLVGR